MKRFLITSPKFIGQAEIVFNLKGTLCIIDCSNTDMDEMTMEHFKRAAPITEARLTSAFSKETTIVEAGFEVSFDKFYKDYPLKRNRYKAEKAWAKLNDTERVKAFYSLHGYKKYLTKNNWLSPMIADAYLTRREFETEWHKIK